ncbi:unnamed protein product [Rotaria sp. Silwood1]|nr:unnamed protein product [Rotaria sp. Silwood1]CAF1356792.1 unnamed protein product [Rotaria sp. Silwood1]CAF1357865.1 unnamed protein product [Rotaria sp. Silwood1]
MLAILNFPMMTMLLFSIVYSSTGLIPQCGSNRNCCKTAGALKNANFIGKERNIMTAIAYYESVWGLRKGPNRNPDGSTDNGLFQVNSYTWCSSSGKQNDCCCPGTFPNCRKSSRLRTCRCGCRLSCSQAVSNNALNIQCARIILGRQGYRAWAGYNAHTAECNSYDIFNGLCSAGSCCSDIFPGSVCCPQSNPRKQGCCPSTHKVCCRAPYQSTCCSATYPVCCARGCCPAGTHCCGTNQCCSQKRSYSIISNQTIAKPVLNIEY